MHVSRDDLFDVRDGAAAPPVSDHVASCPACSAEVARLRATAEALRALPECRPPKSAWIDIHAKLNAPSGIRFAGAAWAALLVILLSLSFVVFMRQPPLKDDPALVSQRKIAKERIEPLMARSKALEERLSACRAQPVVQSGKTAGTIATLEDGLAIVDLQLSLLQSSDAEPTQLLRLWEERVKLLSALVDANAHHGAIAQI